MRQRFRILVNVSGVMALPLALDRRPDAFPVILGEEEKR
jgi:hypothetical protein